MNDTLITELLAKASECDEMARALRKQAGLLLAQRRSNNPVGSHWRAGIEARTCDLLIQMAVGTETR